VRNDVSWSKVRPRSGAGQIGPELQTFANSRAVAESLKKDYEAAHVQYRLDDEIAATTDHHRRLSGVLKIISSSFRRPISVLDAGCGTGRYFHCLKQVARLVGIDLSPDMLKLAATPVRQEEISVRQIELICANLHCIWFPEQCFEFIYSLGVFGHGCPDRFYDWLTVGGKLFFNVVDPATLPLLARIRRQVKRRIIYPWLPRHWQKREREREARLPFFGLTKSKLEAVLRASRFDQFRVFRRRCRSPLRNCVHLECAAWKT